WIALGWALCSLDRERDTMSHDHVDRMLAAILAADVVGYSRIMATDETATLAALKLHRQCVFDPR
ncbi:hypothetical protein ACC811_36915, partial [Rhizobium ruizarguesonis]